jgi:hypothetical protein
LVMAAFLRMLQPVLESTPSSLEVADE